MTLAPDDCFRPLHILSREEIEAEYPKENSYSGYLTTFNAEPFNWSTNFFDPDGLCPTLAEIGAEAHAESVSARAKREAIGWAKVMDGLLRFASKPYWNRSLTTSPNPPAPPSAR
jgi:hypothetical protein